jgi:hypothetical protein
VACRKGQQRNIARTLDCFGQLSLVIRTGPGNPARGNLAPFGDEVPQGTDILVVDRGLLVCTETTNLATAVTPTRTTTGTISTTICHDYFSFFIVIN